MKKVQLRKGTLGGEMDSLIAKLCLRSLPKHSKLTRGNLSSLG